MTKMANATAEDRRGKFTLIATYKVIVSKAHFDNSRISEYKGKVEQPAVDRGWRRGRRFV